MSPRTELLIRGRLRVAHRCAPIRFERAAQSCGALSPDSTLERVLELANDLPRVGDDSLPARRENDPLGPVARRVRSKLEEPQLDELLNGLVGSLAGDPEAPSELTRSRPAAVEVGEHAAMRP